jgi:predicted alpha/beta-fold hydrolase
MDLFPDFPRVDFQPHRLLRSGHAQTCFTTIWPGRLPPYRARQHVFPTTHDDQLVLHDDQPGEWRQGGLTALLIHGLGGCHRSAYLARTAAKLNARGVRTFRLDMRGCGSGERLAKKPGHAGRSEDVAAAVQFIHQICPGSKLVAAGFSLGGNILLKWLAESGSNEAAENGSRGVDRALAVSAPIDLALCAQGMEQRQRRIYTRFFVRILLRQLNGRRALLPDLAQIDLAVPPRTLYEFDDRVTAPLSGFACADEYYALCSAAPQLGSIRTPTVLLTAADDPLIPVEMYSGIPASESLAIRITRHGGHVGFYGRSACDPDWYWLDWRVVDFVMGPERQ